MSYVTVNLDPGTWGWLQASVWVSVALTIGICVVLVYHFVDQFRTPPFAKRVRDAHRSKKAGLLLVGDDGYGDYEITKYSGSEGWSETKERGKPKWNYIGFNPRPGKIDDAIPVDVASGKSLDKTRRLSEFINYLNTRKVVVRGSNNPLWVGVKSKAILASIQAIAAVQMSEVLQKKWDAFIKAENLETAFPIDISAMKRMVVSSSYNASQVIALTKIHEQIGYEKRPNEQLSKWVIILGIALVITGAVMLGIAAFR